MKFVLAYTLRDGGSVEDRVEGAEAAQKLLSNWAPSDAATIHEWVTRCDGNGGFSVVETDNSSELLKDLNTWTPWLDFQVFPVVDIAEASALQQQAIATAKSVV